MKKTFLLAIALLCFCAPMSLFAQKQLAFKDGKFKIVQFTDIHWDQKSSKCAKTVATIQSVLKAENPDVAMLTGDVVTANPGLEGWKSVIGIFEEAKIPFTVMMGNHDAEIVSKDEIYAMLSKSPYFMGEKGPGDIHGAGNYVVPVYSSDGKKPAAYVYFRNDCSGKSAWTGQQSYLSLFKYFAVYCCRLSHCGSHSVTFFIQVADRNHFIVAFHILDSHDIFG